MDNEPTQEVMKPEIREVDLLAGASNVLSATYKHCPLCGDKYHAQKGGASFVGHLTGYVHQVTSNSKLMELLVEAMKEID